MGNRANYVIVEHGQAQIFYSRWGAVTIPSVLLSGPEGTLAYIRQLTPDESLLDDVWAEGGVLVNVDTHCALFWGGSIATCPYLRRPLLAALSLLWSGWSIDWAQFGVADLAQSIGWEVSQVLDNQCVHRAFLTGSEAIVTETHVVESLHAEDPKTILSIRRNTGDVKDYLLMLEEFFDDDDPQTYHYLATLYRVLSLGPRLLNILPAESTTILPREGSEQEPQKGAYLDEEMQTIWIWENKTLDARYLEAVARRWPGWQVQGHVEGMVRHVILSGRDPAGVKMSDQQAIQELITTVAGERGFNPVQVSAAIQHVLPPADLRGMKFGKGFFSGDAPLLAPQERRDVLEHVLLGLPENGALPGTD